MVAGDLAKGHWWTSALVLVSSGLMWPTTVVSTPAGSSALCAAPGAGPGCGDAASRWAGAAALQEHTKLLPLWMLGRSARVPVVLGFIMDRLFGCSCWLMGQGRWQESRAAIGFMCLVLTVPISCVGRGFHECSLLTIS